MASEKKVTFVDTRTSTWTDLADWSESTVTLK